MHPKVQHGPGSGNQSDDEMAFMCYYGLLRCSQDETLKTMMRYSFYRYWVNEAPEMNPFFNFAYAANLNATATSPWGDVPGQPLAGLARGLDGHALRLPARPAQLAAAQQPSARRGPAPARPLERRGIPRPRAATRKPGERQSAPGGEPPSSTIGTPIPGRSITAATEANWAPAPCFCCPTTWGSTTALSRSPGPKAGPLACQAIHR